MSLNIEPVQRNWFTSLILHLNSAILGNTLRNKPLTQFVGGKLEQ